MAFSLFGKKPAVSPSSAKKPVKPSAQAEEKPVSSADEVNSLDFTQPGEMPRAGANERIQVAEVAQQVPSVIEQAAMLFAADQAASACETLRAAVHQNDFGRYAPRAWGMLFDLYQELGRQADFEALALEYAARFESSPPAWRAPGQQSHRVRAAAAGRSGVAVAGVISAKTQDVMQQLLKYAEKSPSVRLDLAKVSDADEQGCALLNGTLRQLKKAGKECALVGADKLAGILAKKVVMGTREREHTWLLLLALYQQTGAQEAFEETAVNYAVTFEVSPPSWEAPPVKASGPQVATPIEEDNCALEGDIIGTDESPFVPIRLRAEESDDVVVDVSRLHRMDFIAAANLMNVVSGLVAAKKNVRFVKASHLLTALWEVIGLDRVARIEPRKT